MKETYALGRLVFRLDDLTRLVSFKTSPMALERFDLFRRLKHMRNRRLINSEKNSGITFVVKPGAV